MPKFDNDNSLISATDCSVDGFRQLPNRQLRILFVLPDLRIGGAEIHVVRLVEGLRKRGHDARIMCVLKEGALSTVVQQKKIPLVVLNAAKWDLLTIIRVKRYLDRASVQIVHTYLFGLHFFVGFPARLSRVFKIVSSRRDVELMQPMKLLWLEQLGNFFCDHVIACSETVRQWVLGRENLKPKKITTLYNGLNLEDFVPLSGRAEIRREFCLPEKSCVVGTVANFSLKKGYEYLLGAVETVLHSRHDCYFLLVGAGPLEREMKERASRMSSGDRIIFTGAREDVSSLMAAMDIFVFSSLWEGLPNVVLEAMAMGLPIISTPAGGVPEVITDGVNGKLIPFRDSHAMAAAVLELLSQPEKAREMGRAARKKIEDSFTLERMVDAYENFYMNF